MHKEDVYATSIFVSNCSLHAVCLAIAASPCAQTIGVFVLVCRHTSFRSLGRVVRRVMSRIFDGFGKAALCWACRPIDRPWPRPTTVVWDECVTSSHYSDLHRADRRPLARRRDASHTGCVKATGFYSVCHAHAPHVKAAAVPAASAPAAKPKAAAPEPVASTTPAAPAIAAAVVSEAPLAPAVAAASASVAPATPPAAPSAPPMESVGRGED